MRNQLSPSIIEKITEQLAALKFGELTVVVHDGKVVQIEVKEKIRLSQ
ncbi:MAG: YezD family protein [Opitutales bacterium]|nr:YezD family protein [Opitutales bacterium]